MFVVIEGRDRRVVVVIEGCVRMFRRVVYDMPVDNRCPGPRRVHVLGRQQ